MKNKIKFILPLILLLVTVRSYADLVIICDGNRISNYATVSYTTVETESSITGTLFCTGNGSQGCETPCLPAHQLTYGTYSFSYLAVMTYVWDQITNHSMASGSTLYMGTVPISWSTIGTQATINIACTNSMTCTP